MVPEEIRIACGGRVAPEPLLVTDTPKTRLHLSQLIMHLSQTPKGLAIGQRVEADRAMDIDVREKPAKCAELAPNLAQSQSKLVIGVGSKELPRDQGIAHATDRSGRGCLNIVLIRGHASALAPCHFERNYICLNDL
ncbi:MAG: hypothetical protein DCC65_16015 [Planctomycetota bacterium]|nr:MAG: hypothetical protein DCC65_16015 [Planctomycetota bacterium]